MDAYDAKAIERKWQSVWQTEQSFHVENHAPGDAPDEHYYMLEMLPYPSGSLHMGHVLNYTLGDVVTHFRRRQGFTVLRPMGFDSFGLPAENAAIKDGGHPLEITERNMEAIRVQMRRMGWAIDWQREVSAHEPTFYRWTQWLFLKFLEHGLAYRKEAHDDGLENREAVALGLERTGRVVTSAALLFCVAVGAFATSSIVIVKEVGIGIALAVAIDATLVRALLVPSLMALLGDWNWWPDRKRG